MYHLLLDRKYQEDRVKYVSDKDYPKYATVNGEPVFFNFDKEFRIAIEYTIIYPKIYVKKSKPYRIKDKIKRSYIQ